MNSQFISTAGTYYVMHKLAMNEIHASCTFGNAPNVDILASSIDGSKSISIQVKTSSCAIRWKGRGQDKKPDHLEWNLGLKAAKTSLENLFFTFVDLDDDYDGGTVVYIVPSKFIFEYFEGWVDDLKWVRFHIPLNEILPFKENWEIVRKALT
jgi:hypothetical protein